MKRRAFLAATGALLATPTFAETVPIVYRRPPPFFAYRGLIASGKDEYPADPLPLAPQATAVRADGWFSEITGGALRSEQLAKGVPYWVAKLDPATGIDIYGNNGIAVGDIDGDGRDEIYVCQPGGLPNKLYKWRGNVLQDISAQAGVDLIDDTSCALFVDLRNLGRQDLVVLRSAGPLLFLNDGNGRFRLRRDAFQFSKSAAGAFTGMAAADYDRDGRLDIYCCCYSFFQSEAQYRYPVPYHDAQNGPPNFLFRNTLQADGSGSFVDVTAETGLDANNNRFSFAPAWCDYDGSGWPSLYVANDFGRNNLYRNVEGRFTDVAEGSGTADVGPGMSAAWFDANGDGRADLYVANMFTMAGQGVVQSKAFAAKSSGPMREAWRNHTKGNSLFVQGDQGRFISPPGAMGLANGRWAWSSDAADFDNDGQPEMYVACGMLTGPKQPDLAGFFWRQVVAKSPLTAMPDSAYENGWNALNQFVREGHSWHGNEPNVFFQQSGNQFRDVSAQSGLNVAADSRAFAFVDFDGSGSVDIALKSRLGPQLRLFQNRIGHRNASIAFRLTGTKSNRDAVGTKVVVDGKAKWLSAGSGYLSQHTKTMHFGLGKAKAAAKVEVVWPSGLRQEFTELDANALYHLVEGESAKKQQVFAAPTSYPRQQSVDAYDNEPKLHDTWLAEAVPLPELIAGSGLLVLHAERRPQIAGLEDPVHFRDLRQDATLAAAYALFRRYLFEFRAELEVPFCLLLNREGHAERVYGGVPSAGQVKADMARQAGAEAFPYPGLRLTQPSRDFFKLGAALLWSGYGEQALPYLEAVLLRQPENLRTLILVAQIHREGQRLTSAETLVSKALAIDAKSAEAWNELGGVAMARKDYASALGHFQRALESKSGLPYVLLNCAQVSEQLGQPKQAEEHYQKALQADGNSADAANGLGLLWAKQGRLAEAELMLHRATAANPNLAAAWNNLGVLYVRLNQPEKARNAFEQGLQRNPGDEGLALNLGRYWMQRQDLAAARQVMEQLLKNNPRSDLAKKALADLNGRR